MADRRKNQGYADYATANFRPSENVENRARRGMNGTAQRWALRTRIAEDELRHMRQGDVGEQPYGTKDIEDWIAKHGYRGEPGQQFDFDSAIWRSKLQNQAGHGDNSEHAYQDVQPIRGLTDAMYPDEIRMRDAIMALKRRPTTKPVEGGLMEYNGGLEPFAGGGAVRRLSGALSTIARKTPGKPDSVKIPGYGDVAAEPIKEVTEAADSYMRKQGRPGAHHVDAYEDFDEERAARIAEAFERMQHNPTDPEVRRAYDAMIAETLDQYESLKDAGVDFRFLKEGQSDPYAQSPALGYADTIENGRLWVFPTDQGFGTLNEVADNPLLKRVGRIGDLENATANDAFRAVHDMYGHFGPGNPFFRHKGEERAWDNHSRMYSKDALPAMTTETRGQNSWLNFGPYGEQNRNALGADTVFADQKIGLLPSWAYGEGYADGGMVDEYGGGGLVKRTLRAFHTTHEPFKEYDWSRLGRVTGENTSGSSVEEYANNLARLGPWASERPLTKEMGMDHALPVEIGGEGLPYRSLEELEAIIRDTGGPEALRERLLKDGYGHVAVDDEEFKGKSYIGLAPEYFRILPEEGYAIGGLVGGMEQVREAVDDDDLVDPAMFAGKLARKLPHWMQGERGKMMLDDLQAYKHEVPDKERLGIERELWKQEGIGLNRDGHLMHEIDDSNARLKDLPDFGPDRKDFGSLADYSAAREDWERYNTAPTGLVVKDVLDHPELYEQYPGLDMIPLKMSVMDEGNYGALHSSGDSITKMEVNRRLPLPELRDTFLHELQHGVQRKEGWTPGSNLEAGRFLLGRQQRLEHDIARVDILHKLLQDPRIKPETLAAYPQALAVAHPVFKGLSPMELGDLFARARTIDPKEIELAKTAIIKRRPIFDDAHAIYERNEGEVMARNTMDRSDLTAPERRDAFWRDTEDRQGEPRLVGPEARIEY